MNNTQINIPIYKFNLTTRSIKLLSRVEVKTANDLIQFDVRNLNGERNCGEKSIKEISILQSELRRIETEIKKLMPKPL